ncbi:hypothetical protein ACO0LF_14585 [Undibacterium sp. Di27W]
MNTLTNTRKPHRRPLKKLPPGSIFLTLALAVLTVHSLMKLLGSH